MPNYKSSMPSDKLAITGITKLFTRFILLDAFLLICAGDFHYWNVRLYLGALFIVLLLFGIYLYRNDQELLEKRLNSKEKEDEQKVYVVITLLSLLSTFTICGLDYRFGWSHVPTAIVFVALAVVLGGFGLFVLTLLQNRFASKTIEIQDKQKVIDTGLYSVIRHPLYTAAIIMFLASPITLGSFYAVIPVLFYIIGIILRIRNEEKVLCNGLEGYTDYLKKVKYRLIPYIW